MVQLNGHKKLPSNTGVPIREGVIATGEDSQGFT